MSEEDLDYTPTLNSSGWPDSYVEKIVQLAYKRGVADALAAVASGVGGLVGLDDDPDPGDALQRTHGLLSPEEDDERPF